MMRAVIAQTRVELVLTLRRGESVLLAIGIPVLLLIFFSTVDVGFIERDDPVDFVAPGVLALAVMSTAMVGLGIATGFERQYGVLKRLGASPLGRPALLAAKTLSILAVEALQIAVLAVIALLLGWDPDGSALAALGAIVLATVGFAGIGLLMAGTMRGEVVLAAANGLYLVLLLLGGMVIPLAKLPETARGAARMLPAAALSDALHGAFAHAAHVPARAWVVLLVWAVAAPLAAAWTFRWE
jgi:ABC-2 type transport system permease protein